jgi:3-dehydroquinate dehydratase type I
MVNYMRMSLICVPIREKTLQGFKTALNSAGQKADLFEIWVDDLCDANLQPEQIVKLSKKPLIIKLQGTNPNCTALLQKFAGSGAAYIDLPLRSQPTFKVPSNLKGSRLILSYHNFKKTPSEKWLWQKIKKGFAQGADIVKIATFARAKKDNLTIFRLLARAGRANLPLIALCMGKKGLPTRLLASQFNSYITYVAPAPHKPTAPGQLTIKSHENRHRRPSQRRQINSV